MFPKSRLPKLCLALSRVLIPALFCAVVLHLGGCSKSLFVSATAQGNPEIPEDDLFTSEAPIEVKVSQTFYDRDGRLHVKVMLKPKVELQTSDLVVTLVGLRDGVPTLEETKRVSEVWTEPTVAADSLIAVQFDFIPPEVSEFQVRASWGDEGREAAAKAELAVKSLPTTEPSEPTVATADNRGSTASHEPESVATAVGRAVPEGGNGLGVTLKQLRVEEKRVSCDDGCDRELTVVVELRNQSSMVANSVTLAVKLVWVNEGEPPPVAVAGAPAADEELVELTSLSLAPGQSRQVRVAIDRQLPEVDGGAFVPLVRLLSPPS